MSSIWEKAIIKTDDGSTKEGIAPIIISASRATDIPAFYAEWFMSRIQRGYIRWHNPFSPAVPKYISFEKTRLFVFWSKNPAPLIPWLAELDRKGFNYYFQYTLNDYVKENFEPTLPSISQRVGTFKQLAGLIGKEKVIWRFDPLILSPGFPVEELLDRIKQLGDALINYTNKLVISFVDILHYKKVYQNMIREISYFSSENIHLAEFTEIQKYQIATGLENLCREWRKINPAFRITTCGESIDLTDYGMLPNKCIDDELIYSLFPKDKELLSFLGYETNIFEQETGKMKKKRNLKDKNQRKFCSCIYSKDIGSYNTCFHFCTYCYANHSRKSVKRVTENELNSSDSLFHF